MGQKRGGGGRGRGRSPARRRRGRPARRGVLQIGLERLGSFLTTLALLGTGALVASWWIEWRETDGMPTTVEVAAPAIESGHRLKVEVLNGSGEPGAAGVIGDLLLDLEYDVVAVDNAEHFDHEVTHVIDRSGAGEAVREIGRRIGADSISVELDPDLLLDATIILGKDWRALNPGADAPDPPGGG
ncbi:MAG: LytR C-terminal domain-containing protein [Gemmatimonadota bacterium]|nr:LytR C-terminal domain-containing protein [Gemmatimonadota bacterium]